MIVFLHNMAIFYKESLNISYRSRVSDMAT